jgi:DNA polymerase III alpha subunit
MILEDETGFVNVAIWSRVFEEHVVSVKISSLLGVTGTIQKRDGIAHIGELPRHPAPRLTLSKRRPLTGSRA